MKISKRILATYLTLKDEMSRQMSGAKKTVGEMKKELANLQEQIKKNEDAQIKASQSLDTAKAKEQELIKSVLENSDAYKDAVKSIQEFKDRNEDIASVIKQHEAEMASLQKTYKDSKAVYDNAKSELVKLKQQHGANSDEVKEQERNIEALQNAYNSALGSYRQAKDAVQNLRAEYKSNNATIDLQIEAQENLAQQLIENNQAVKDARQQMKNYEQQMEDAEKAVKEAREEARKMTPELNKSKKAFDDAKKSVKDWGKNLISSIDGALLKIAKWGTATASLAGGFAVKTGFETAFDLEAYRTQLDTAVKDTERASKLMKMAQDFSNASPFTSKETIQSTATMEAYGVSSEHWLKMVADMAGATNKEMEQATGALIDALTKQEFQGLEEFGISKEMVIDKANLMYGNNKVFKKSGELRKNKDKEMKKVIETLMTEKFDGGAEKLSKTVKGLWSTVTGVTSDSLAKIFGMENGLIKSGSALDILKQRLEQLADTLTKWQQDGTLDEMAEKFTETMSQVIDGVSSAFNYIKENKDIILFFLKMTAVIYGTAKAVAFFKTAVSVFSTLKAFATGAYEFAKGFETVRKVFTGMKTAFIAVKAGILALSPAMLPVVAGIIAVAGSAYLLYKNFDKVVSWAKAVWEKIKGLSDAMPTWAKVLLLPIAPIFAIIDALELLSNAVSKAWKWIKGFFTDDEEKNIDINTNENLEKNITEKQKDIGDKKVAENENQKGVGNKKDVEKQKEIADILSNKNLPVKTQKEIFKEKVKKSNVVTPQNKIKSLESKKERVIVKEKPQINVTINGDVYGYNDFKDKIKKVMDEIIRFDLQNTV